MEHEAGKKKKDQLSVIPMASPGKQMGGKRRDSDY